MDFIHPKTIAGKFFINHLHAKNGAGILMRGRVVGPVANELSPFYLCEIFPPNDAEIAITTETIMQLEQLVGVYFYETREQQQAAWTQTQREILARQQAVAKAKKSAIRDQERRLVKLLKSNGITVVDARSIQATAANIVTVVDQVAGQFENGVGGGMIELEDGE